MLGVSLVYSTDEDGKTCYTKHFVLKSKMDEESIVSNVSQLLPRENKPLAEALREHMYLNGTVKIPENEIHAVRMEKLHAVMPDIYWSCLENENDIRVFAMEYLDAERFTHVNTVNKTRDIWTEEDIVKVLDGLAFFHAQYYNKCAELEGTFVNIARDMWKHQPFWKQYLEEVLICEPEILNKEDFKFLDNILNELPKVMNIMNRSPCTFIHHESSPRNVCLRKEPVKGKKQLCLYDFEYACVAPPQADVAHFLVYVLPENSDLDVWEYYVNIYLRQLKEELGSEMCLEMSKCLEINEFMAIFDMAMIERLLGFHITLALIKQKCNFGDFVDKVIRLSLKYVKSVVSKYDIHT